MKPYSYSRSQFPLPVLQNYSHCGPGSRSKSHVQLGSQQDRVKTGFSFGTRSVQERVGGRGGGGAGARRTDLEQSHSPCPQAIQRRRSPPCNVVHRWGPGGSLPPAASASPGDVWKHCQPSWLHCVSVLWLLQQITTFSVSGMIWKKVPFYSLLEIRIIGIVFLLLGIAFV